MTDHWTERLSAYVDGELDREERGALEVHLTSCEACATAVAQVRQVVGWAHGYEGKPPKVDVWDAVARGIREREGSREESRHPPKRSGERVRRFVFTVPQLLAAGIALALFSGTAVGVALRAVGAGSGRTVVTDPALLPDEIPLGESFDIDGNDPWTVAVVTQLEEQYAEAIADLESLLREGQDKLDSATLRVIEENLRTIDEAVEQATVALRRDPAAVYLSELISVNLRRKLELLRDAAALVASET
jgi:hypothetical protein